MKKIFTFLLLVICTVSYGQNPALQEIFILYASGDYKQVIQKTGEFMLTDSTNLDCRNMLGRALTETGDYQSAIPHLKYAVQKDHQNSYVKAWSSGYLGPCYYMLKDFDNSVASLKASMDLNATKYATGYARYMYVLFGYDDFFKDWKTEESQNIRFHFQSMTDQEIESFMKTREKAFQQINEYFKITLPKKIDYFVWNSREDAKRILNANLGFANPGYCVIHSHYQQTKGHEMTHVISHYLTKEIKKTALINEGTAVCFDLTSEDKEKLVLDRLAANKVKIDIKELWVNFRKYPEEITYPLSGLFVKEMIDKLEKEKFLLFFADQSYENAKAMLGDELDKMIRDFEMKFNN